MSTMTIDPICTGITAWTGNRPSEAAPREAAGALRLTRRGRMVVLGGFLMLLAVLAVAFGPMAAGALHGGTPEPVRIVVVYPGDTLYDIAGSVAAPGHVNDMVAHIEQLNALSSPVIQPGQKIAVPVSK